MVPFLIDCAFAYRYVEEANYTDEYVRKLTEKIQKHPKVFGIQEC